MLFDPREPSVQNKRLIGHSIGIMGIDLAPYQPNLFLYLFESNYVQQLISKESPCVYKFHGTSTFIDDFCTINDDGEFSSSHRYIYPKQLELKFEHQGEHATFLDLDKTIEDIIYLYKRFLTKGASFLFYGTYALFAEQYSIINILGLNTFRALINSSMYTKSDRFCAQGISIICWN